MLRHDTENEQHAGKRQSSAHVGEVALPEEESTGYAVHPALGDACIHLAAIPAVGADANLLR